MATVGLIGCGRWGRHILRDLRSLGCRVAVVADSPASVQRALDGGADSIVGLVGDLPAVDGVIVATPTTTHASVVRAVLPLAVPVFVEKPLAPVVADAVAIAEAASDRVFVMDKWRYHPGIEQLAALAHAGELGRVVGVRTERLGWGNPHVDVDATWILMPHDLSIGIEVLGRLPPTVAAVADVVGGQAVGLHGLLRGGADEPWMSIEVSARHPVHRRTTVVLGEDAVAELSDGYATHITVHRSGDPDPTEAPVPELIAVSDELPLRRELRAFVEHLHGGPPPRSSAADAVAVVTAVAELRALAGLPETTAAS